ncbi:MAG: transcriptional regulator [Candidatus Altiarchaeales archaeon]|nr:transcriptional regulator [Candidatus Altiarchaeales archaeon]
MKLIIAYIPVEKLDAVKKELDDRGVFRMSVTRGRGCGQQKGYFESYRGSKKEVNLLPNLRLEIAVNDDYREVAIDAICAATQTGSIGDGKIFVLPLEECIRIRTGERGPNAIGGESRYCSNNDKIE